MFRHQGKSRTFTHNRQIATILSFVAGIVNVTGFLALGTLTANVTGHFTQFINNVDQLNWGNAMICFLSVFFFLFGSFVSSILIEFYRENKRLNVYVFPIIIESIILLFAALWSVHNPTQMDFVPYLLLFAMGLQNSCVTKVSNAVVRTTHLTGLFTDLGIELSHLLFKKLAHHHEHIKKTIKLRLYIICFFFLGGSVGFYIHTTLGYGLKVLIFAVFVLVGGLFYDDFKFRVLKGRRRFRQRKLKLDF